MNNTDKLYMLAPSSFCQMMGYVYKYNDTLIVIDGGTKEDYLSLLKIVKGCGSFIDLLVVTHCHHDHIGALIELIANPEITIKKIIYDFPSLETIKSILKTDWEYQTVIDFLKIVKERKIPTFIPELNKTYLLNEFSYIFYKLGDIHNNDINDSSLIFKLISPSKSILFLGDISPAFSGDFAKKYSNSKELECDFVQLAHHGQSGGSFSLYQLTKAKYGLWNAPKWLFDNDLGNGYDTGPFTSSTTKEWLSGLNIKSITAFNKTILINQNNIFLEQV